MKKIFTLLFAIALSFNMMAQCPLTTAVDFTATDCHGTEVHLFDILDGGQYVLMDFFFTTCGPCQQATPKVVESYYAFGCNMHDVYYVEISDRDSDAACQNWVTNYGVEYPTISGAAGGSTICNQYQIPAFPTVILIAPDHSIVIQDLWPINNAQTVISALENHGIQQYDCQPITNPEVTITVDQTLESEVTATFTPNEFCASYYYTIGTQDELNQWMASTGLELPEYLQSYGFPADDVIAHTFDGLVPDTEYQICAVGEDSNGVLGDVAQEAVTTTPGGIVDIIPDFTGIDIEGNEIHLYEILDAGQAVVINFFLEDDPYSQTPMPFITESYRSFGCNQHDVFYMEICPNADDEACIAWAEEFGVEYPTISRAGGGNDIAQAIPVGFYPTLMLIRPDHTIAYRDIYPIVETQTIVSAIESEGYMQYVCEEGVEEIDNEIVSIYPNPVNDFLTISGDNIHNVQIFNVMGQKIVEIEAVNKALNINTSNYDNGVYFVKVGNNTQRFIVTH